MLVLKVIKAFNKDHLVLKVIKAFNKNPACIKGNQGI
jgi:hypothetical protein